VMTSARSGGVMIHRSGEPVPSITVILGDSIICGRRRWAPCQLLTKPAKCKKCHLAAKEIRGVPMRTMAPLDRRNVKSVSAAAADAHERGKDFLSETEIAVLLDAAKAGRYGVRDHLLILTMYRH